MRVILHAALGRSGALGLFRGTVRCPLGPLRDIGFVRRPCPVGLICLALRFPLDTTANVLESEFLFGRRLVQTRFGVRRLRTPLQRLGQKSLQPSLGVGQALDR